MNLDAAKDLKVLFIGDNIIDEYVYVKPLGKSIKENALSVLLEGDEESFVGGVYAAAQHAKEFCRRVDFAFGAVTMHNKRYVQRAFMQKLFTEHRAEKGTAPFGYQIADYDVVVVTDFGHGTMNDELIDRVMVEANFLAVNAQTNTQNYGFNMVTKYRGADFAVVDELEARLAAHERDAPLQKIIPLLGFEKVIVTLGTRGAIGYDNGRFYEAPAVSDKVVDTMGAGDAFLAVTAPFAAAGLSMPDLLKIGNAAGAIKVGTVGHRQPVTKEKLCSLLQN